MMKKKKNSAFTDRDKLTIADLLESDRHQYPRKDVSLTLSVRDWLKKFAAGEPTPFGENLDPDDYKHIELAVAVLLERGGVTGAMLPGSAIDFVEDWLYRLEESTNLHIWNVADIARLFLAHVASLAQMSDSTEGCLEAMEATFSRLCTQKELAEFYKRHGLGKKTRAGGITRAARDEFVALKAARLLADPNTLDEKFTARLLDGILHLSSATGVSIWHPALVERALTLMFESMNEPITGKHAKSQTQNRKQTYEKFHTLLAEIPDSEQTAKPVQQGGANGS